MEKENIDTRGLPTLVNEEVIYKPIPASQEQTKKIPNKKIKVSKLSEKRIKDFQDKMIKFWNELCLDPVGNKLLEENFVNFEGFYKEVLKQTVYEKIKSYRGLLNQIIQ